MTTLLTIKILLTINSLKKKKNYSFKTLFTIPVDLIIIIIIIIIITWTRSPSKLVVEEDALHALVAEFSHFKL